MKISNRFGLYLKTGVFVILASVLVFSFSFVSNMFTKAVGPVANDDTIIVDSYQIPIEIEIADLISNDEDIAGLNFQITSVTNGFVNVDSGIIEFYPDDANSPMSFTYKMSNNGQVDTDVYLLNGHYYKFMNDYETWEDAFLAAQNETLIVGGKTLTGGYLVEINDMEEDLFLTQYISESAWTSGNDIETEGQWYWGKAVDGKLFWQGYGSEYEEPGNPLNGTGIDGVYNNWQSVEPNDADFYAGEDCLMIDYNSYNGDWNDRSCGTEANYIIEFEDPAPDAAVEGNEATVNISLRTGDLSCTVNGVTAYWTGSILDVYCGNDYIENYGATEITLTGEANDEVSFESYFDGFTTLNLNNLTENNQINEMDCDPGDGCIFLEIENTDKLDINILGDNLIRDLYAYDVDELNITGPGKLSALYITNEGSGSVMNINTNIYLLASLDWHPPVLNANGGDLNILSGSLMIEGEASYIWLGEGVIYGNGIYIANDADVVFDLNVPDLGRDVYAIHAENSLTFGDRIVGERDSIVIDDLEDMDNYLITSGNSAVITFSALAVVDPVDPVSPTPPSTDSSGTGISNILVPNTGIFGSTNLPLIIILFSALVISGFATFRLWRSTRQKDFKL